MAVINSLPVGWSSVTLMGADDTRFPAKTSMIGDYHGSALRYGVSRNVFSRRRERAG